LPVFWRLVIHSVAAGLGGGLLFLRLGLPPEVLLEAGARLPAPIVRFLKMLVPRAV
jgi:hypothetical protein